MNTSTTAHMRLLSALLALLLAVASPPTAAVGQVGSPGEPSYGSHSLGALEIGDGGAPGKALRPTSSLDEWEVLEGTPTGEWRVEGTFQVIETIPLRRSFAIEKFVAEGDLERFEISVAVGELAGGYVAALLIDAGMSYADHKGGWMQSFTEIARSQELAPVLDLALKISNLGLDRGADLGRPSAAGEIEGLDLKCSCTDSCDQQRHSAVGSCLATLGLCDAAVGFGFTACILGCPLSGPVALTCGIACVLAEIAALLVCDQNYDRCVATADARHAQCVAGCAGQCGGSGPGGGDGGGGGGSGSECTIAAGEVCPASCFECTVDPFL